jgi:hypothetical protein
MRRIALPSGKQFENAIPLATAGNKPISQSGRKEDNHITLYRGCDGRWPGLNGEPYALKGARTVVRPAKAGMFSEEQIRQGKSRSPVAWAAAWREIKTLEPADNPIFGIGAKY